MVLKIGKTIRLKNTKRYKTRIKWTQTIRTADAHPIGKIARTPIQEKIERAEPQNILDFYIGAADAANSRG